MNKASRNKMLVLGLLSLVAAATLVACGGGGSSAPTAAGPVPPADAVAAASVAVATAVGATVIAGASADEELYNMTADIGDSWQLILNNRTNTYVVRVLSTQSGLTSSAPAAFTKTTAGAITTITATTGTALSVQIDTRMKTLVGSATLGSKTATVSGTAYVVPNTALLAGNYLFLGSVRNVSNGLFPYNPAGTFIVAANGTDVTACDGGIVVNGVCAPIPGGQSTTIPSVSLKVSQDSATGLLRIKQGTNDFGTLTVIAGDRGPVLVVDRFGLSDDPSPVLRTGLIFGAKAVTLAGNEFNGSWTCSLRGIDRISTVVTGNTYTVRNLSTNAASTGTIQYNKAVSQNGVVNVNGAVIIQDAGQTLAQASLGLPLSSSLGVISDNVGGLQVCRRTS